MAVWLVKMICEDTGMPGLPEWEETITVSADTLSGVEAAVVAHKPSTDPEIKLLKITSASLLCERAINTKGDWV